MGVEHTNMINMRVRLDHRVEIFQRRAGHLQLCCWQVLWFAAQNGAKSVQTIFGRRRIRIASVFCGKTGIDQNLFPGIGADQKAANPNYMPVGMHPEQAVIQNPDRHRMTAKR